MYYPQAPKEPSGCMQSILITRAILGLLLVPLALIGGAILLIVLAFYALSIHPLLGLLVVVAALLALFAAVRWETKRVEREIPRDE